MNIDQYPPRGRIRPLPRPNVERIPYRPIIQTRPNNIKITSSQLTAVKKTILAVPIQPSASRPHLVDQKDIEPVYIDTLKTPKITPISKDSNHLNELPIRNIDKIATVKHTFEKEVARDHKKTLKSKIKHHFKKMTVRRTIVGLVVLLILGTTGYLSLDIWQTNNRALRVSAESVPVSKTNVVVNGNTDKKTTTVSQSSQTTVSKPTVSALSIYKVSSDLPRAIYINKINVAARLMPMGLNSDNSLQAPTNIYDAGWYTSSAKPGQSGAMLVDGHGSETGTHYGLLGYLTKVTNGDQIIIERGDGTRFTYVVVHTEIDALSDVDMNNLLIPYSGAQQGINLIACTGKWTSNHSTLDHRILVFAVLQS
jgi:sortase (surface protein transpeptidase)